MPYLSNLCSSINFEKVVLHPVFTPNQLYIHFSLMNYSFRNADNKSCFYQLLKKDCLHVLNVCYTELAGQGSSYIQIKIEEYVIGKLFFLYEKPEDSHISVENYK